MAQACGLGRFVFIDDAHTFGGTQIALSWVIRTVLTETDASVVCLCTERTREAVEKINGENSRLQFEEAPRALPLNLLRFPVRILRWMHLLERVRKGGVDVWWLNLSDIEFCLAPLLVLRWMGESPRSYLHGTSPFQFFQRSSPWKRRLLSRVRDWIANRFAFQQHKLLITPSLTSLKEVESRIRSTRKPILGHLYYPPIGENATSFTPPVPLDSLEESEPIRIWMIGTIVQGHKNNLAAMDVLEALAISGHRAMLTVAGAGPDLSAFQKEASRRGLSESITYLGWVKDPCELAPKDAVIFIPSFHETMNIVAREAMRIGLRLVASPIAIFHEWIPSPLIAESFAAEAFAKKILELRRMDPAALAQLYRNALDQFSNTIFLENFLRYSLYNLRSGE